LTIVYIILMKLYIGIFEFEKQNESVIHGTRDDGNCKRKCDDVQNSTF